MPPFTLSAREFNQDASRAKRAAADGPVFITDRGRPAHVLLSIEDYRRLTGVEQTIVELISAPAEDDFDFEAPPLSGKLYRPANLS